MNIDELALRIADFSKAVLNLENVHLSDEYYYSSLPLCVIDAVFSIGVIYSSTRNTVIRFCNFCGIERISEQRKRTGEFPALEKQMSINEFLSLYQKMSSEEMAKMVFGNRQRTSSRNGILKSEAVKRFSLALKDSGICYFHELFKHIHDDNLYKMITSIPGQKSGISLNLLFMLAGRKDTISPGRMVRSYLSEIIGKTPSIKESKLLLTKTHELLDEEYPNLTLREFDHSIWSYQRTVN